MEKRATRRNRRWWEVGPRAYKILWDAHSMVGVVVGLALFVIFFCGAFALFRGELHQWADPALRGPIPAQLSADAAVGPVLEEHPPRIGTDMLLTWPFGNRPYWYIAYESATGEEVSEWVAVGSGDRVPPPGRSHMPDLLNELHFFAQLGTTGEVIAGLLGVLLFFALLTGVLVHLRKLPEDLHTFRPREKLKVWLADLHTALGTLAVPFVALFAISGAYFALLFVVYGTYAAGALQGDLSRLDSFIQGMERPAYEASGIEAAPLSFDALLESLPDHWGGTEIMEIRGWGDANGQAILDGGTPNRVATSGVAVLDLTTGEALARRGPEDTPPVTATAVSFVNLHFAWFGGALLKGAFFLLSLATSAVVFTGNLLWLETRRSQGRRAPWHHGLLARLNSGVGVGLVAAVPLLLLVTRFVPLDQPDRVAVETNAFFGAWSLFILMGLLIPSARTSARWLLIAAGYLALMVPVANGGGTGAWPWVSAIRGDWVTMNVDLGFGLGGAVLLWFGLRGWPRVIRARDGGARAT